MSAPMTADMSVGERIHAWRNYRGMTQEQCAALVGKSLSWWQKVEMGLRHVEKLSDLILISQVLKVKYLEDITGALEISLSRDRLREHPVRPRIQGALQAVAAPSATMNDAPPQPLENLRASLNGGWETYWANSRFITNLADIVPTLLADLHHAYRSADDSRSRRDAAALLSEAYILTCHFMRKASAFDLAQVASDRALLFAQEADRPLTLTLAAWAASGVLKDQGLAEESVRLCMETIPILEPHLPTASHDVLAAWGKLQLQTGLNAGHTTDEGTALRHWDVGEAVMRKLPADYMNPVTEFCHADVGLFAIRTNTALGKSSAALQAAQRLDISSIPARGTRALGLIDVARGHIAKRSITAAMYILREAESASPEVVEHNIYVREIVRLLLRTSDKNVGKQAHEFAQRIGLFSS